MSTTSRSESPARLRVLIAGGGVAGLKTLLALRAFAGDRVDITILAPELKFINRSMSVDQPFKPKRGRGMRLQDTVVELDAHWHQGTLDRVEHTRCRVVTKAGDELPYDRLVLALGAHPEREWQADHVLTYHGGRDGPSYTSTAPPAQSGQG
jgi:NADH dehydrogenase FAD-containing subunit